MRSVTRLRLWLWCLAFMALGVTPTWSQVPSFGQPQLSVSKAASPAVVAPGQVITYTLTLGNTGTAPATGIAVSDVLPQGTTFVEASDEGILFGSTVYWSPGSLDPNQTRALTLRVRVNPGVPNGTTITNSAQISSVEAPIGVPSNPAVVTVGAAPQPSALTVTKLADAGTVSPGQTLTYTLSVANNGAAPVSGVTLTDPIPAGTTAVSASDGGVIAGNVVTWSLGTIAGQSARQVTLQVQVNPNASGTLTNTAQASAIGLPAPVNSNSVSLPVSTAASLSLTKTVDRASAAPGELLTYTLAFNNQGAASVQNVSLFDVIPVGTQFVDSTNNGVLSGDSVVWTFAGLAPGAGGAVSFRVRVLQDVIPGTQIRNQAQLAVLAQGVVVTSQPVITTVAQGGANLTLAKFVDRPAAQVGDILTYTLNYANLGTSTAVGVEIIDPLPAGLSFLDAQGDVQVDIASRTLRFNVGDVAPQAFGSILFRARVESGVTPGGSITNQATLTAAGLTQPVPSNTVTTIIQVGVGTYTGTYGQIQSNTPTWITVDPQNKITVATVARIGFSSVGLGAQGSLRADGSFDVTDPSGRVRFQGQVNPSQRVATITAQWIGRGSYTVTVPKAADFSQLPAQFVGTYTGFVTNPRGDRLRVLLTIDPGGNSTFQADLIQLFPTLVRHRTGSYQITPNGLVTISGGRTDGVLQPAGDTLVLIYNYITTGYQATFQIPLIRR